MRSTPRVVLTDSGGVQEERTFLGLPCFTLQDNTERPVTIRAGTNRLLGLDPSRIDEVLSTLRDAVDTPSQPPALWDGRAAERIAHIIAAWNSSRARIPPGQVSAQTRRSHASSPAERSGAQPLLPKGIVALDAGTVFRFWPTKARPLGLRLSTDV